MLTTPTILNALLTLSANPATLVPMQTMLPVRFPITFSGVSNLQVQSGSYTPANDTKLIASGLSAVSPNFVLFMCDGLADLSSDNAMLALVPVNKVIMLTMAPIVGGASPIDTLTLSGLVANAYPMIQGVALNYTLVYGQAVIT